MSHALNIPFDYNQKEYYEFVWLFERLVKQRNDENDEERSRTSISNLGVNMSQHFKNNGG